MLLGGELVKNHAPLRFPHSLNDDLPGGLGGDTAKVPSLDLEGDHVPQHGLGQLGLGFFQRDLGGGVIHRLHHVLFQIHPDGALLPVGVHHHIVPRLGVVLLVGGDQGQGDFFHHIALGDAPLLLDEIDGGKELGHIQLVGLGGFLIFSRHSAHSPFI